MAAGTKACLSAGSEWCEFRWEHLDFAINIFDVELFDRITG